ncbi:glycerate kinase [soil metagenome]
MRILLALDKFKGSLTSKQASDAVTRGLRRGGWPDAEIEVCPIADGGEGFTEAVLTALGGEWHETPAHDACGRLIQARYGMIQKDGKTEAIMEMCVTSGLAMVSDQPLNPYRASTLGTGEMMQHAIEHGAERIMIGIGGSATNDGGSGMASVMGYDFLDAAGQPVGALPADLERVERMVKSRSFPCEVIVACDVTNPLLGEHGATNVYGPQKGVKDVAFFESRLTKLADMVQRDLGCDHRHEPGAGAAGGLGFGLMSFCGARLQSGFDLVADITGLQERIQQADMVITGEGKLDAQTLHGKGPMGVAAMARAAGKSVIGLGGIIDQSDALISRFDGLLQIKPDGMAIPEAIARAAELLEETVAQQVDWFKEIASKH